MSTIREQAREAVHAVSLEFVDDSGAFFARDTEAADAASDVWERATAAHRLKELGIDRDRLNMVLNNGDNWGHLVYAFEVLTVLGVVLQEMEALDADRS